VPLRAGAPASVEQEQEQEETSESPQALEEAVILPPCRWTDHTATVTPETDAESREPAATSGGCPILQAHAGISPACCNWKESTQASKIAPGSGSHPP